MDFSVYDRQLDHISADKKALYSDLESAVAVKPDDVQLLWRLTKAALLLSDVALDGGNSQVSKHWAEEAVKHARAAVEADDKCIDAHKWSVFPLQYISLY